MVSATDALNNVTTYVYDKDDEEINMISPNGGVTTYGYNALGEETAITLPGQSTPTTYSYDEDGNELSVTDQLGDKTVYTYNNMNWLATETVYPNGTTPETTTYSYDALDNRIGMDENSTQTWTLYDQGNPIMDFNSSGYLTVRYLWGPMGIVARQQTSGETVSWYLADALGTVRDLINNSGTIIDHIDFSAFGNVLDQGNPSAGDRMMGFAGLEQDAVIGLNLAVFREENPGTGRWDSRIRWGSTAAIQICTVLSKMHPHSRLILSAPLPCLFSGTVTAQVWQRRRRSIRRRR